MYFMGKKKLIEVYLPLDKINKEAVREKSIRHGHPSTLHLWWARRPLAACRAILFAQLVDDPSGHLEKFPTIKAQKAERERLCKIIEELVLWENINNEEVLTRAREEIIKSTGADLPAILDPFCGGGSIPLEAQRLGLNAYGSDLNPIAVLITKALIEIPPKFAGLPPVHPKENNKMVETRYEKAQGLAEDIRYYGKWMKDEAEKKIGYLYPKIELLNEDGGGKSTVIAWLWARTVESPNPACNRAHVPLVRTFYLSRKKGRHIWIEPKIDHEKKTYHFEVRSGSGKPRPGTMSRQGGTCLLSGVPIPFDYIRKEAQEGRMGSRLMAIVAEGDRRRVYVAPSPKHEEIAKQAKPSWRPDEELQGKARVSVPLYGMNSFGDLFTPRQLVALTTFSDLIHKVKNEIYKDAVSFGMADDGKGIDEGGTGAAAYADAIVTYLAFAISRLADRNSAICSWDASRDSTRNTFARQAIPMIWDYAEVNPFSNSTGNFLGALLWIEKVVNALEFDDNSVGFARQLDATEGVNNVHSPVMSMDPPYYDNVKYSDLADFFYVWLRRSLIKVYPELFETLLTPKAQELVAAPRRFDGDRQKAHDFFEKGLKNVFEQVRQVHNPDFPMTIYYAFKQSDVPSVIGQTEGQAGVVSTGWETMLEALISAGFTITGTWPIRTELMNRPVATGTNALASSIVLVCRPRDVDAPRTTRRDFTQSLMEELPDALRELQQGNIAPVDLQQAAIGPGMAVFSRYSQVIEADGSPMSVRMALALINQMLAEYLTEQEGDYDPDTRWAVTWFEQYGFEKGSYGVAETLSKAKNVSIQRLEEAGILVAKGGDVRILRVNELKLDEDLPTHEHISVWQAAQYLARANLDGGEKAAAQLLAKLGSQGEMARQLAYRLYVICERKGWAAEGYGYNALVSSWSEITKGAGQITSRPVQISMLKE